MFFLPAIGVSACAKTIDYAISSFVSAASQQTMRARVLMSMTAAAQQHPSSAAAAPRTLSHQTFRAFHDLHDSLHRLAPLLGVRSGPRSVTHKSFVGFTGPTSGCELDGMVFVEKGEPFYFGGVKSGGRRCRTPSSIHTNISPTSRPLVRLAGRGAGQR